MTVPCTATFASTANHSEIIGDLTRRTLRCSLDPQCERPELREFDEDPVAVVRDKRGQFVADALTVVLAYRAAGSPKQEVAPLGSYEVWSRMVRSALLWLGEADPVDTMEKLRGEDPVLAALRLVMTQWEMVFGIGKGVTLKEVIATAGRVYDRSAPLLEAVGTFVHDDLRAALVTVAGDGKGGIDSTKLGNWLKSRRDGSLGTIGSPTVASLTAISCGRSNEINASG
jgi:putative DNA primase/helicase